MSHFWLENLMENWLEKVLLMDEKKTSFWLEISTLQGKWYGSIKEKVYKKSMKKMTKFDSSISKKWILEVNHMENGMTKGKFDCRKWWKKRRNDTILLKKSMNWKLICLNPRNFDDDEDENLWGKKGIKIFRFLCKKVSSKGDFSEKKTSKVCPHFY